MEATACQGLSPREGTVRLESSRKLHGWAQQVPLWHGAQRHQNIVLNSAERLWAASALIFLLLTLPSEEAFRWCGWLTRIRVWPLVSSPCSVESRMSPLRMEVCEEGAGMSTG